MPDLAWLLLPLPIITVTAYMMDIDEDGSVRNAIMRVIRWDMAFMAAIALEYYFWFD